MGDIRAVHRSARLSPSGETLITGQKHQVRSENGFHVSRPGSGTAA
jgi:hypothetical protein